MLFSAVDDDSEIRRRRQQQQQQQQQKWQTRIYLAVENCGTMNFAIIFNNGENPVDFIIPIHSEDK